MKLFHIILLTLLPIVARANQVPVAEDSVPFAGVDNPKSSQDTLDKFPYRRALSDSTADDAIALRAQIKDLEDTIRKNSPSGKFPYRRALREESEISNDVARDAEISQLLSAVKVLVQAKSSQSALGKFPYRRALVEGVNELTELRDQIKVLQSVILAQKVNAAGDKVPEKFPY